MALNEDDLDKMLAATLQMSPYNPERTALHERAIAAADASGSIPAQFKTRKARLFQAAFAGEPDVSIAMFAWCKRCVEEYPKLVDAKEIIWSYKFVLVQLTLFAKISQAQIDAVGEEMKQAYQAQGVGLRAVYAKQAEAALRQGKAQGIQLWYRALQEERDRNSDCYFCEKAMSLHILAHEGKFHELVEAAQPLLAPGYMCTEVPQAVLPLIGFAYIKLGEEANAQKILEKCYTLTSKNPSFIEQVIGYINFLTSTNQLPSACQVAMRHLRWLRASNTDFFQFLYLRALHHLLLAVDETMPCGKGLVGALERQPAGLDAADGHISDLMRARATIARRGQDIARAFDARNGNDYFQQHWQAPVFSIF